ncbi:MAG: TetR/AcrR family transcriptional regulator [Pseudomonadota bacterium]
MTKPSPAREIRTKKQRTHERIVKSAARALRKQGFDALSVGQVMKDAGLTHGGFYAHFASREALLVEALDSASADGLASLQSAGSGGSRPNALEPLVAQYLSDAHVKHPEAGCALAALGSETRRQSRAVRNVGTERIKQMLALIESRLDQSGAGGKEQAMLVMSALVGALVIGRASSDSQLSRELRDAVARSVLAKG